MFSRFPRYIFFLIIIFFIPVTACKKKASESEAKTLLKAFDYEIIKLTGRIQDSQSYSAINKLISVQNLPLPYFAHYGFEQGDIKQFVFSESRGIYHIDTCNMKAVLTGKSDSIIIHFQDSLVSESPIKFIISEYSEEPTISNLMFPVRINASMYIGKKRVLQIDHTGRVDYGLPAQANLSLVFDNFIMETVMITRMRKKYGKLNLKTTISENMSVIARLDTRARLGLTGPGALYFKQLKMNYSMYPVILDIKVNNDAISRDASNYISEFTKYSRMFAYSKKNNRKLGEINLKNREESDKLDYAISFSNGSHMFLDDLLLSVRHLMSVKK